MHKVGTVKLLIKIYTDVLVSAFVFSVSYKLMVHL